MNVVPGLDRRKYKNRRKITAVESGFQVVLLVRCPKGGALASSTAWERLSTAPPGWQGAVEVLLHG
jgi:hypothetical protein